MKKIDRGGCCNGGGNRVISFPFIFFMSAVAQLKEVADIIFMYADKLTDADYKKTLDLLQSIKDNIPAAPPAPAPAFPSVIVGTALRCDTCVHFEDRCRRAETRAKDAKSAFEELQLRFQNRDAHPLPHAGVCCFTALHEAFTKNPSLPGAKTSRCGCCGDVYPIGYGTLSFRAEGKKSHSIVCTHTKKTCAKCTPAAVHAVKAAVRLHQREGQNVPLPPFLNN